MIPRGVSGNCCLISSAIWSSGMTAVFSVLTVTLTGLRHADRVGKLHLGAGGQPRGNDVLGDVAGHVAGAAIDLGRVLAAERPAAVAPRPP